MLVDLKLTRFLDTLSSNSPAPGGGSVAALSGALAAGLIGMVGRLTVGKKGFEASTHQIQSVIARADILGKELVDLDTRAFNQVMTAFKMPRASDEEKSDRSAAIQTAFHRAVNVPLGTVRICGELLGLAREIFPNTNPNCLSDLGVAVHSSYAGLCGAMMNVNINLPSIKDKGFIEGVKDETKDLVSDAEAVQIELSGIINQQLAG
jgi:formiminotetrahydrofolate cyclodeaminase